MKNRVKKQTSIELKGNRVVIRYKSKRWATGYTLHSKRKTVPEQQFSNGRLKAAWNREQFEEANLSILKKKQHIDNLITQAYEKNVDELAFVETYLNDNSEKLRQLAFTKNTLLVHAFSVYINEIKGKSKKLTEARSLERYFSELHRLERYKPNAKLGEIEIRWIEEFTEFLSTPKEETREVYDKRKGSTYSVTKVVSQTDSTIIRFLKDLKSFFRHIQKNSEINLPLDDIQEYIEILASKKPSQDQIIALTQEQWDDFKNFEPNPHNPAEVKTYDAFKFSVLTGVRWSDLTRLEDFHVVDGKIKMHAEKTNAFFEVPMKPEAENIFNKYDRSFVGKFSQNQQQNKNLRKILRKLHSFQYTMQKTTFRLGKAHRETIKAYEQITFHSSRRTFASFCVRH
ncbi:MAG: hypothetical protein RIF46_16620, partial [Cyclobacteriaceae bacterium]